MSTKFQVLSFPGFAKGYAEAGKFQVPDWDLEMAAPRSHPIQNSKFKIQNCPAFTLVEILVTMALLSLIVLSLMTILNSTQTAFRAGITQAGVLESGRAVSDLIKSDLEGMTPSLGTNNGAVNFYANTNSGYTALLQSLPGSISGYQRTNVVENFFILTLQNRTWTGVGYRVDTASQPTNSLYRFSMSTNVMAANPWLLYSNFIWTPLTNSPPWSHLMDGVVELRVRAYDPNGFWMTNTYDVYNGQIITNQNTIITNQNTIYMFSNTLPASVEVELGVLEDRALQRAESLSGVAQLNYLSNHVGQVHIFRQRAWIHNVDPSAYK
ncbi:MAG: type II secretion system protein [Verrucomicrobiota bacterium]|jgi:prepilin-type N-terminal cleavage/methylation domain-containing protein